MKLLKKRLLCGSTTPLLEEKSGADIQACGGSKVRYPVVADSSDGAREFDEA